MKRKKNHVINICLALTVASFTILLTDTAFFQRLELLSLDTFFQIRFKPKKPSNDIVIVEIERSDIKKIGRWPWDRSWLVKMAKALKQFEAKVIVYDFIMSETSNEQDDFQLQQALKEAGNIYLPSYWNITKEGKREVVEPIESLKKYAKGTGFINITSDLDGSFRRIPIYSKEDDGTHFNIAFNVVLDYLNLKVKEIQPNEIILSNSDREVHIPMLNGNYMLLNWYGKWNQTFRRYTFSEILDAQKAITEGKLPAIDLLPIKNSICLVALTATGLYDIKPIAIQPEYPGVGIVATSMSNVLDEYFIRFVPPKFSIFFIYFISLFPPLLINQEKPLKEILLIVIGLIGFLITFVLFVNGYKMIISSPLIALLGSHVLVTAYNYTTPKAMDKKVEVHQKKNIQLKKEYKELSENLQITEKQMQDLSKVNKELDRFVHTVSHDIRSPLLGILGYTDLLQKKIQNTLNAKEKKFLNGIFISIDRLNVMIDDLLQTTKISRVQNPYENVNFNELIESIRQRLDFNIKKSKVNFVVQENLPNIVCDRIKMGEVFQNLITNAVKFSTGNSSQPKVNISYREKEFSHEFNVRDNGIGIDPKHKNEIFEMGKRLENSKKYEGTGVGLSIVKNIIDDHSGQIWVESKQGEGAAFFFTLSKDLKANTK